MVSGFSAHSRTLEESGPLARGDPQVFALSKGFAFQHQETSQHQLPLDTNAFIVKAHPVMFHEFVAP